MSGHSKWHNIQRRKGKQDSVRGQLFTKLSRDIYSAAKEGGANPDTNFRLKTALERARQNNLSADSITRTIAKATGSLQGITYEEILYEGYGPNRVAVMIELVTDNRNRSAAEIRHIFSKRGGNLGESGCVAWMFRRVGRIDVLKSECEMADDDLIMLALDSGAADVREDDHTMTMITEPEAFTEVRNQLERSGVPIDDAEITYEASTAVELQGDQADAVLNLIDALEANDDVQNVYTNAEFSQMDTDE